MPKYLDLHGLETLTSDIDATYLKKNQRGVANGVASLDSNGKVPASQIPGGAGGTTDYDNLTDKPQINGNELSGNKTTANLGIHEIPSGGSSGQVLAKASGTDHDVEWTNPPSGGTTDYDNLTGKPQINGNELSGNKTTANLGIHEIPSGGTSGQMLVKSSGTDYDVEWTNPPSGGTTDYDNLTDKPQINGNELSGNKTTANLGIHEIPSGGTTGQALRKTSGTDHDVGWSDIHEIPSGGTTGQALKKTSGTDHDVGWSDIHEIPSGGTTGQVLKKSSGTDYAVEWANAPSGGSSDYSDLTNKPQINGTELSGNKTAANLGIHEIPSGGTTGQVLKKSSGTDYAVEWANAPSGGSSDYSDLTNKPQINGTELSGNKTAANLGIHEIPSGGTYGQILAKSSGTDYAVEWVNKPNGADEIGLALVEGLLYAVYEVEDEEEEEVSE